MSETAGSTGSPGSHLQESPENLPIIHYYPPLNLSNPITVFYHQLQTALDYKSTSSPSPPHVVIQLANLVRSRLSTIYNSSFSIYHILQYSQSSQDRTGYGDGTLFTIHIAPKIQGHSALKVEIFKSEIDTEYLVHHSLD